MTRPALRIVSSRSDHDGESDEALLTRVGRDDMAALGLAFDRYHRDVYAFLARMRGSRSELDDLVQTIFLALPAAARGFDGIGSPRSFVLGVAFQHLRRERRRVFRRFTLWRARENELDRPSAPCDPERLAGDRQDLRRLQRALDALPEAQRETFLLVEVEGLKGEEVAGIMEVPVNTVWTRLHHARKALREALSEGYIA